MRRFVKRTLLVVAILMLLGGLLLWSLLRRGLSTHDEPSQLEVWVARSVRHWATPADLRGEANPLPLTPQVLAEARAHWADHCASCHGNDGRGKTVIGEHLYPRAPDMTLAATQSLSDGEMFSVIENGIRLTGMPGWGNGTAESAYGSWGLVHFVRHLPRLTPEEIRQMEALNPASPDEIRQRIAEEEFLAGGDGEAPPQTTGNPSHGH